MEVKIGNNICRFSEFRPCETDKPTESGDYLVIGFHKGHYSYAINIHYTTKYGWNTSNYTHESPIIFKNEDNWEYFWCTITTVDSAEEKE